MKGLKGKELAELVGVELNWTSRTSWMSARLLLEDHVSSHLVAGVRLPEVSFEGIAAVGKAADRGATPPLHLAGAKDMREEGCEREGKRCFKREGGGEGNVGISWNTLVCEHSVRARVRVRACHAAVAAGAVGVSLHGVGQHRRRPRLYQRLFGALRAVVQQHLQPCHAYLRWGRMLFICAACTALVQLWWKAPLAPPRHTGCDALCT